MEAGKPFRKRSDKLKDEIKDKQRVFDKAMKHYCFSPGTNYPDVAGKTASAQYYNGFLTYRWLDADGKQLVWALITMHDRPVIKDKEKIAELIKDFIDLDGLAKIT